MIDEKGRLFGKVSLIDCFVVITVALIIAFGILAFGDQRIGAFASPIPIEISFLIENLETFTADSVFIGDPVFDNHTGASFGNIINIDRTPTIEYHPNALGIATPSYLPDHYQLEITTRFYGHNWRNGVWVNGQTFFVGETIVIQAGNTNIFTNISNLIY
ncbi:MAG: DUF4330 domain-containing protein [Defluviitaleaceae bacterium]|nr:DUF4330 domain-containing protein [Defluviitaleaceae bacterium]